MLRRALLVTVVGVVAVLVAVSPARAAEEFFLVTGTGDAGGVCAPYPNFPGGFSCTTLRAAISAANASPGDDLVVLQNPGTYQVDSAFELTGAIEIAGQNARTTMLDASGETQLFHVNAGADVVLTGMTLANGTATSGNGGAVLNDGTLGLEFVHIMESAALEGNGGAIANNGALDMTGVLIDENRASGSGGGIYNGGALTVDNSTIYANMADRAAGAIYSERDGSLDLRHATVAANTAGTQPGGIHTGDLPWSASGSLFGSDVVDSVQDSNCDVPPMGSGNVDSGTTCGGGENPRSLQLGASLTDEGGQTDVLAFPPTSAAKNAAKPCGTAYDQRLAPRGNADGPCDAGAYQQGATAPPVTGFPFPVPTPTPVPTAPPTPTPVVTPTPIPTPVPGTPVAKPVKGKVRIRLRGSNRFIDLDSARGIPDGSTVDTRHGTVQLTAVLRKGGKPQTAIFFDGLFRLGHTRTTTDLTLNEALAPCRKRAAAAAVVAKKRSKPKTRRLWGSGHGSFRTKGRFSAATVRGTKWLVRDSCAGTLTRVAHGVVAVRDEVRHRTILLRAGRRYLARPRRR